MAKQMEVFNLLAERYKLETDKLSAEILEDITKGRFETVESRPGYTKLSFKSTNPKINIDDIKVATSDWPIRIDITSLDRIMSSGTYVNSVRFHFVQKPS